MAIYIFKNATSDQAIDRELLIAYLNTGTYEVPVWSPLGCRVESSNMENDWQRESKKDIMGHTHNTMKKPITTQNFDPWPLAGNDVAQKYIWEKAIVDEDAAALCNLDILVVHSYVTVDDDKVLAIRNDACSVELTSFGGDGGASLDMSTSVTYGGKRTVGAATVANGEVTFAA